MQLSENATHEWKNEIISFRDYFSWDVHLDPKEQSIRGGSVAMSR